MRLRRALWRAGLRYRVDYPISGIRPDVVFTRAKLAIFVDGCFWHGCPTHYVEPVRNAAFWRQKVEGNRRRDESVTHRLQSSGWRVLRFWECEINEEIDRLVREVRAAVV